MGTGTMVIGLASVIIGISLLKKVSFIRVTTSVIIGSIIYKACVAIAIKLGMPSSDLKMITAVLFLVILVLGMDRKKERRWHRCWNYSIFTKCIIRVRSTRSACLKILT